MTFHPQPARIEANKHEGQVFYTLLWGGSGVRTIWLYIGSSAKYNGHAYHNDTKRANLLHLVHLRNQLNMAVKFAKELYWETGNDELWPMIKDIV